MDFIQATFVIPGWISAGLAKGTYERVGGVIREQASKKVVAWLRDSCSCYSHPIASGKGNQFAQVAGDGNTLINVVENVALSNVGRFPLTLDPVTGVLNLFASGINTAVSVKGFASVNVRLDKVDQRLDLIEQGLQSVQASVRFASAASVLNLGLSAASFAIVTHRLNEIEQQLQQSQEILNKINRKIDFGYYANFRAALDLATNAFAMTNPDNRRSSALKAIDRFLEAEHIFIKYLDEEIAVKSLIADEYFLTLMLAYIAESRCYLELEEFDVVPLRLAEAAKQIKPRMRKYVELLLTTNPAAYLDPQFKGQIDLQRLTKIYQWIDPGFDENMVFEHLRENLFNLKREQCIDSGYAWVNTLPGAIVDSSEVKGSFFGNREEVKQEAIKRLPQTLSLIESLIETDQRFEAYQTEVKAIAQLGISFHDWIKLAPLESQPEDSNLIYLIPTKPMKV